VAPPFTETFDASAEYFKYQHEDVVAGPFTWEHKKIEPKPPVSSPPVVLRLDPPRPEP